MTRSLYFSGWLIHHDSNMMITYLIVEIYKKILSFDGRGARLWSKSTTTTTMNVTTFNKLLLVLLLLQLLPLLLLLLLSIK